MYHEINPQGYGLAIETDETLFCEQSPFQKVEIMSSKGLGNILTLDGLMMTTEKDEFFYHEMIAHIPLITHKNPENILVIGAGDGGTVREVLKHKNIKTIEMCEIDGLVIEASKKYLPTISCELENPKVKVLVQDAIEYIKDKNACYDVVLVDSTDPLGPGVGLFTEEFYTNVKKSLKKGGIVVAQSESPFANPNEMKNMYKLLKKVFKNVVPYCGPVPTYPAGYWSWAFCSEDVEIPNEKGKFDDARAKEISKNCKLYNENLHYGVFCVPNFVKRIIE